jgi:hypothetical protein
MMRGSGTEFLERRLPHDLGGGLDFSAGAGNERGGLIAGNRNDEWLRVIGAWAFGAQRSAPLQGSCCDERLEAVGSQDGGHFEDATVVIVMLQLGARWLVDDEGHVGMMLEC